MRVGGSTQARGIFAGLGLDGTFQPNPRFDQQMVLKTKSASWLMTRVEAHANVFIWRKMHKSTRETAVFVAPRSGKILPDSIKFFRGRPTGVVPDLSERSQHFPKVKMERLTLKQVNWTHTGVVSDLSERKPSSLSQSPTVSNRACLGWTALISHNELIRRFQKVNYPTKSSTYGLLLLIETIS